MSIANKLVVGLLSAAVVAVGVGAVVKSDGHKTASDGHKSTAVARAVARGPSSTTTSAPLSRARPSAHTSRPATSDSHKRRTVCGIALPTTSPASPKTLEAQTSESINATSPTDFSSCAFKRSVFNLKHEGVDEVTLIVTYEQDSFTTSDIHKGPTTPTRASLASAVRFIRSLGLRVMLSFHDDLADGDWRAFINASDRATWFARYGSILDYLGTVAKHNGATEICLGTELYDMTSNNENPANGPAWLQMIASLKKVYKGELTYAGQRPGAYQNETTSLSFWPEMSQIGIDAYYPLGTTCDPSVASMVSDWKQIDTEYFAPLIARYHKPILFTELGFSSVNCDNLNPAYYGHGGFYPGNGAYDGTVQSNLYQALFEAFASNQNFAGINIWFWYSSPAKSYPGDVSFSTYRKPAGAIIKKWFLRLDKRNTDKSPARR